MRIETSAPSNIALIKYMGKEPGTGNKPANPSLSYTLDHLRTFVTLESVDDGGDRWEPLSGYEPIELSATGRTKFLAHFGRLKAHWGINGHYLVRSANNFPSDCGLASSASSFAALTLATGQLAEAQKPSLSITLEELSRLSRLGSGSSCRSIFSPWAEWVNEGAKPVDLKLRLEHGVVIVDSGRKSVSSSEAHARIASSLLWGGRVERAQQRMTELVGALRDGHWAQAQQICWAEFWDMHALFETSQPAFGYMSDGTLQVLARMRQIWSEKGDGPLVTMDAGANVHLLLRVEQKNEALEWARGFRTLWSWS